MRAKTIIFTAIIIALLLLLINTARGQSATATQGLTLAVSPVTLIAVNGGSLSLTINAGTAGENALTAVNSTVSTYSITHNKGTVKKITGSLDSNLPTGISITANLASTKGSSAGAVTLSTTAVDLVTGISKGADKNQTVTYNFQANADAGELASVVKTVTYTLTD